MGSVDRFFEDFSSGLDAWNSKTGQIVTSPVDVANHGNVIHFTSNISGGDTFTKSVILPNSGEDYIFSFDYLGIGDACGYATLSAKPNYVDSVPGWLFGYEIGNLINDSTWHSYSYRFTAPWNGYSSVWLALEQYTGTIGNAYFDNIQLAQLPEPAPWQVLGTLLGTCGLVYRRRWSLRF